MELVAYASDTILSTVFEELLSKFVDLAPKLLVYGKPDSVVADLGRLEAFSSQLSLLLQDAEKKKQDNPALRAWLVDLEKLIFEIEDVTEVLDYVLVQRGFNPCWKLLKFIKFCLIWEMPGTVKNVTGRLGLILERSRDLGLHRGFVPVSSRERYGRVPSTSLPVNHMVFGRNTEIAKILGMLKQDGGKSRFDVIVIVGMGGLGKTTLAQGVFNASSITEHFRKRAWVCVSSDYDIRRIMKEILDAVVSKNSVNHEGKSLDWLQRKVCEELRNVKFLLVLDDVWKEDPPLWDSIHRLDVSAGSKILVTTRSKTVAEKVRTMDLICPSLLSDQNCWSLLRMHSALDSTATSSSTLEEIGRKIAGKCRGLPLAVVAVSGLLVNDYNEERWEAVLNSTSWNFDDENDMIMSVLKMSYDCLHPPLKKCFAFFAIFPEDYCFMEHEVVTMWIGAGLIPWGEGKMSKEKVGRKYFNELLSKSLFSYSGTSDEVDEFMNEKEKLFVMHDLIRQVAQGVTGRSTMHHHISKNDELKAEDLKDILHLSFHGSRFKDIADSVVKTHHRKNAGFPLRTLWPLSDWMNSSDVEVTLTDMFSRLRYLRVLRLPPTNRLSKSIGELILLKHLEISNSTVRRLPDSVTSLYNLEVLILCCKRLEKLPENLSKLINLWLLDTDGCVILKQLPKGIDELKMLRKLSNFIIGGKLSLSSLGKLKLLEGKLTISGLENVTSPEDAESALLCEKRLNQLELRWPPLPRVRLKHEEEIVHQLQPIKSLKRLKIVNYCGSEVPTWLESSLRFLEVLELKCCRSWSKLSSLASLEVLCIVDCPDIPICLSSMPVLKRLLIDNCKAFEFTEPISLESLQELRIFNCSEVKIYLPNAPVLNQLRIHNCKDVKFEKPISLDYLRYVTIFGCLETAIHLPSMPALERLEIENCKLVRFVNPDSLDPLPYLRIFNCSEVEIHMGGIPALKMLSISCCKDVKFVEVACFDLLEDLMIFDCSEIAIHLPSMAALNSLFVENCKQLKLVDMVCLDSLRELSIHYCLEMRIRLPRMPALEKLHMNGCTEVYFVEPLTLESLRELEIFNSLEMRIDLPSMPEVKRLEIDRCKELKFVEPVSLDSLLDLRILNCSEMTVHLPSMPGLEHLTIFDCKYVNLVEAISLDSVRSLIILQCAETEIHMPGMPALQSLSIEASEVVKFVQPISLDSLQELMIFNCPEMTLYLPRMNTLKSLRVSGCTEVKFLEPVILDSLQELTFENCSEIALHLPSVRALRELDIDNSYEVSFANTVIPDSFRSLSVCNSLERSVILPSIPCLEHLNIFSCKEVKLVDPISFDSIQRLTISNCPKASIHMPGMPTLRSLEIEASEVVKFVQPISFDSLQELKVDHCNSVLSILLPSVLANLLKLKCCICSCDVVKAISRLQLPNLTSLTLSDCKGVVFFPAEDTKTELVQLASSVGKLKFQDFNKVKQLSLSDSRWSCSTLKIENCEALESFQDTLPTSIKKLIISDCPLLASKLRGADVKLTSKISHIPYIDIRPEVL